MFTKNFSDLYLTNTGEFTIGLMVQRSVNDQGENGYWVPDTLDPRSINRLWFEHNEYGDEFGGGLWFDKGELIDYDGCGVLPIEIVEALEKLGFNCEEQRKYGY